MRAKGKWSCQVHRSAVAIFGSSATKQDHQTLGRDPLIKAVEMHFQPGKSDQGIGRSFFPFSE
jgi:hypothetical protein